MGTIIEKIRALDPKLVAVVVVTALTYVVTDLLNLGLEDPVLGAGAVNITYSQVIALVAGAVAGYWKPNAGTILRTPQESGNADLSKLRQAGYGLIELLFAVVLLILIVWLIFALAPGPH